VTEPPPSAPPTTSADAWRRPTPHPAAGRTAPPHADPGRRQRRSRTPTTGCATARTRRARLPRGGERPHRRRPGTARRPAGHAVRGDQGPGPGDRRLRSRCRRDGRRRPAGCTTAARSRAAVPDPLPPAGPGGVTDPRDLPDELRRPVDPEAPAGRRGRPARRERRGGRHDFFRLGGFAVSPDHRLAAEAVDTTGSEVFRDPGPGPRDRGAARRRDPPCRLRPRVVRRRATFLYTVPDDAWRPHQVWRHRVGTPARRDELVHEEDDERFWLGVGRTRSDRFLAIHAGSKVTSEWHLLDARTPRRAVLVASASTGSSTTSTTAATCSTSSPTPTARRTSSCASRRSPRRVASTGSTSCRTAPASGSRAPTPSPTSSCCRSGPRPARSCGSATPRPARARSCDGRGRLRRGLGPNPASTTRTLRFVYTSLTTPTQVVDLDLDTGRAAAAQAAAGPRRLRPGPVRVLAEWATAPDGTEVPISLVRRADVALDGTAPCLLYGYGSYEISIDPTFSTARLSLLERGVVFAIAHVRGGGEMGRAGTRTASSSPSPTPSRTSSPAPTTSSSRGRRPRPAGDPRRVRRRAADRRGAQPAARPVPPRGRRGAVRRRGHHDVGPVDPAHRDRVRRVGRPGGPAFLEVMRRLLALRQRAAAAYPRCSSRPASTTRGCSTGSPPSGSRSCGPRPAAGRSCCKTELGAGHAGRSGRYDAWRDEAEVLAFVLAAIGAADVPCGPRRSRPAEPA
jgi:oligopeptidase B